MSRSAIFLLLLFAFGTSAFGGPNAGGVLNAHDADLLMSATNGSISICGQGSVPMSCETMDPRVDGASSPSTERIWKVYAVFSPASSPRLMGVTWGIHYSPDLVIAHYGKCGDFELNDDGWPGTDKGSTVTWNSPQTATMIQVYWFGGYAYAPVQMQLIPNPSQGGTFGDDSVPALLDPIAGYGSIGFDMNGQLSCACCGIGACCSPSTGACTLTLVSQCASPDVWHGEWNTCDPNPCPAPIGACCNLCLGECQMTIQADCVGADYVWIPDVTSCEPNPCPAPVGACCDQVYGGCTIQICASHCVYPWIWHPEWTSCTPNPCPVPDTSPCCDPVSGVCQMMVEIGCPPPHVWHPEWTSCDPNPCPPPLSVCCDFYTGECTITTPGDCHPPDTWHEYWDICDPNPCPPAMGACCRWPCSCLMTTQADCADGIWMSQTSCVPLPCDCPGACCYPDGHCEYVVQGACPAPATFFPFTPCTPDPCQPGIGACCNFCDLSCQMSIEADCLGPDHLWFEGITCNPDPCPVGQTVCCNPATGSCSLVWCASECAAPGIWHPELYSCGPPNPCEQPPIGACCDSETGICSLTIEADCVSPDFWMGPDHPTCTPNPCPPPTPVQRQSWGRIKETYR